MTSRPPTKKPVAYAFGPQLRNEITRCRGLELFLVNSNSNEIVRSCCLELAVFLARQGAASMTRADATSIRLQSCLFIKASLGDRRKQENRDRNQSRRDLTVGIVKDLNQCRCLRALPLGSKQ